MSFTDKTLNCSDCSKDFTFTADEQEQFQQRGYTNEPKRCPECRDARKADRLSSGGNRGGNSYSNNRFSSSAPRQMYPATCSDCGKATTIPFEPKQGRPVYCSDCYRKVRNSR
jgi:CxxC-x17-CxxC domain-containing protein